DWLGNSDQRLKTNIQALDSEQILNRLLALQGITYEWADEQTGIERPTGLQYGFTAQNIQSVFPSLVEEDAQGYLQTAYGTYDAMYVEAIRALHLRIKQLEKENTALQLQVDRIDQLAAALEALQATVGANQQQASNKTE
ncbi:MAG: tail fiber domain-containing protein, partial [Bacteroidota bacterium]